MRQKNIKTPTDQAGSSPHEVMIGPLEYTASLSLKPMLCRLLITRLSHYAVEPLNKMSAISGRALQQHRALSWCGRALRAGSRSSAPRRQHYHVCVAAGSATGEGSVCPGAANYPGMTAWRPCRHQAQDYIQMLPVRRGHASMEGTLPLL